MLKQIKLFLLVGLIALFVFVLMPTALAQEADTTNVVDSENVATGTDTIPEEVILDQEVTADDLNVAEPKVLPGDTFYFLKDWWRGVRLGLTFNKVKKAELRQKIANERLIETKKLLEKNREEDAIKNLEKLKKDVEKRKGIIKKIREKAEDNPKIDKFLDKIADQEIKRQKILQNLEEKLSPEKFEKIKEIRERSLETAIDNLVKLDKPENTAKRFTKALEKQKGSNLKHFKNLEILKELENKVPETARPAIQKAQENALKRLHAETSKLPAEKRKEKMENYLKHITGKAIVPVSYTHLTLPTN